VPPDAGCPFFLFFEQRSGREYSAASQCAPDIMIGPLAFAGQTQTTWPDSKSCVTLTTRGRQSAEAEFSVGDELTLNSSRQR
jgi:hypothetical protein